MKLWNRIALTLCLSLAAMTSSADAFDSATEALLKKSLEAKSGLQFYVDGQTIGAYVLDVQPDVIIVANREFSRIVIKKASIDAIAGNP